MVCCDSLYVAGRVGGIPCTYTHWCSFLQQRLTVACVVDSSPACSCSNYRSGRSARSPTATGLTATVKPALCSTMLPHRNELEQWSSPPLRQLTAGKWSFCCCTKLFSLLFPLPKMLLSPSALCSFHWQNVFHKKYLPVASMVSWWLGHHHLERKLVQPEVMCSKW